MGFMHIVIVGIIVAALAVVGWFVVPKGNNQIVIRTSIALTLTCTYLMWAITYLAQLHPLIAPRRGDLRPANAF